MRKIIFALNTLLLCIIAINVHADQSTDPPYSELDLIKKPFPPSAEYPSASRFNDISEYWSKPTTNSNGFHHLDSWEVAQVNDTHTRNSWEPVLHAGNSFWDQWHIGDPSIIRVENNFFASYSASGFDADGIKPHPDTNFSPNYKQDIDGYYYTIGGAYSNRCN